MLQPQPLVLRSVMDGARVQPTFVEGGRGGEDDMEAQALPGSRDPKSRARGIMREGI